MDKKDTEPTALVPATPVKVTEAEAILEAVTLPTALVPTTPVKVTLVASPGAVPVATTCPTELIKKEREYDVK